MKHFLFVISWVVLCASQGFAVSETALPLQGEKAAAYQKYQNRSQNELSKLIYLMDVFRGTEYKVVFNTMEYDSTSALQTAKNYIAKHYTNENAMEWIEQHSYRSPQGQIIYLKSVEGESEILRDALLRELKALGT